MSDLLLVFVKDPRPGAVKTRLVPALGAAAAAELYRALAEEEMRRTAPLAGEYERLLFFTPPEAAERLGAWLPAAPLVPQRGADLGERMAAAFAEAFARGVRRAALVGTDAPFVSRDAVRAAFAALERHDVVLGPALDGGYYLVALRAPWPELFAGIEWSTAAVLDETLARARGLGLSPKLLDPERDIDTLEDVRAEWPRLQAVLSPRPDLLARVAAALATPSAAVDWLKGPEGTAP